MTRRLRPGDDTGAIMLPVLGFALILLMLISVSASTTDFTLKLSRKTQDVNAALQAAEGAVSDYVHRVNADPTYVRFTHVPAADCTGTPSVATVDSANPFMSANFAPLPGGPTGTSIRYRVDTSRLCTHGQVVLTAYGRSQQIEKTVTYIVKQRSSAEYTYFSDYEALAPSKYPADHPWVLNGELDWRCNRHHYEPSKPHPTTGQVLPAPRDWTVEGQCAMVNWIANDVVRGPMHSNDPILVCGFPTFVGNMTTSWTGDGTRRWLPNPGCSNSPNLGTSFDNQFCPMTSPDFCYDAPLQMPAPPTYLKSVPGACVYTGPTKVHLEGYWIRVNSPNTVNGNCPVDTYFQIPSRGLIYVQDVPAGAPNVPCTTPAGWTNPQNPVGYPEFATDITSYGCRTGDLFVSGGVFLPVTVAAENRVVATNSLYTYRDHQASAPDIVLGVIGFNDVEVYHPVDAAGNNLNPSDLHNLHAAILAVNGSFLVQNYDKGDHRGVLYVEGGISQKWRGLVGTTDLAHGYQKVFFQDPKLRERTPPYWPKSVQGEWRVVATKS